MFRFSCLTLACALLVAHAILGRAQDTSVPSSAPQARAALGFNPVRVCPRLAMTDDEPAALVIFWVGRTGVPSRAVVKSSSRSQELDAAAIDCVMKLRFQPLTRLGDGEPVDSWQAAAWTWAHPERQRAAASAAPAPATAPAPAAARASEQPESSRQQEERVGVRVCADKDGRVLQEPTVTRSSGDHRVDEAAIAIARSGAPYYHPGTTADTNTASGCAKLLIEFETN